MTPTDAPAQSEALASAHRWVTASMIAGGFSAALFPVLSCLLLVTMGVAMFLFPILLPGFLVGFLCAMRGRQLEAKVDTYTPRTKKAFTLNAIGLAAGGFFTLVVGCIAGVMYFGR